MYLVHFSLPDGKHLMLMNSHPSVAGEHAKRLAGQNPDAVVDKVEILQSQEHFDAAVAAIRDENPGRQLANELGLDSTNRILTDPTIARTLAEQQGNAPINGGAGCC